MDSLTTSAAGSSRSRAPTIAAGHGLDATAPVSPNHRRTVFIFAQGVKVPPVVPRRKVVGLAVRLAVAVRLPAPAT